MSNNALRKLIRQRELPEDGDRLTDELYNGSDHTAVLLCVSQLQNALEQYIVATFAIQDEKALEPLFEPGGVLSSFHLITQLAYVLGLIDTKERGHLDRIRAIRNVFAHAMRPVGFHIKEIATEANKLPLSTKFSDEYPMCTPRERFVFSTWEMGTEYFRRTAIRFEMKNEILASRLKTLERRVKEVGI